jgi:hypothetical protein
MSNIIDMGNVQDSQHGVKILLHLDPERAPTETLVMPSRILVRPRRGKAEEGRMREARRA